MPVQKGKSALVERLGRQTLMKAHEKHKDDPTTVPGGDLPAGLNGIAQLAHCRFAVYEQGKEFAGKDYFYSDAIVKRPAQQNGVPVAGLRTMIIEPLCDTPNKSRKTLDDHIKWVYNALRLLGVNTKTLPFDGLEAAAAALEKAKPYFRFQTWQGKPTEEYPDPRVNHKWLGVVKDFKDEPVQEVEEEEDETKEESSDNGNLELRTLGESADAEDTKAQLKLTSLCKKAGLDPEDYETWTDVANALVEGDSDSSKETDDSSEEEEESSEEEEEEEETKPDKGDVWFFKPSGKKKAVECEVMAVFIASKKCNLKEVASGVRHKGVDWSDLKQE